MFRLSLVSLLSDNLLEFSYISRNISYRYPELVAFLLLNLASVFPFSFRVFLTTPSFKSFASSSEFSKFLYKAGLRPL